jgi:hypothetical protein
MTAIGCVVGTAPDSSGKGRRGVCECVVGVSISRCLPPVIIQLSDAPDVSPDASGIVLDPNVITSVL